MWAGHVRARRDLPELRRRDAVAAIKREERDGLLGSDEAHRELEQLQRVTDRHVAEVDKAGGVKEREVLEV